MGKPLNCTTSLSAGRADPVTNSSAAVLQTQEAQLALLRHGKQVCVEGLEGHSAFSGCFSSRE